MMPVRPWVVAGNGRYMLYVFDSMVKMGKADKFRPINELRDGYQAGIARVIGPEPSTAFPTIGLPKLREWAGTHTSRIRCGCRACTCRKVNGCRKCDRTSRLTKQGVPCMKCKHGLLPIARPSKVAIKNKKAVLDRNLLAWVLRAIPTCWDDTLCVCEDDPDESPHILFFNHRVRIIICYYKAAPTGEPLVLTPALS